LEDDRVADLKILLAGTLVKSEETFDVLNKYSGAKIESLPSMGSREVDLAVKAANNSLSEVGKLTAFRRREILEKVAALMLENQNDLTDTLVSETGMTLHDAKFEVNRASNILKMYATDTFHIQGEALTLDADARGSGRHGYSFRVPVGVVGAISAFNNPLVLLAHKLGPAFAAGNAIIFKPASLTPLAALKVGQMFIDAGLPQEALSVLTGKGELLGPLLAGNSTVRVITFTGGKRAGAEVAKAAGVKRLLMELGSNCPNIVCPDADLDFAAKNLVSAAYSFQGQNCLHAQRILVQESVYEQFKSVFIGFASKLKKGDPRAPSTDIGPMITEGAAKRVEEWVNEAKKMGANLLLGGNRSRQFFEPTLLENVSLEAKVSCEEVFGPVSLLIKFSNLREAVRASNDTDYGLQAGIFTHRLDDAVYAMRTLRFGTVMINESSDFRVDMMPFGGFRGSGLGREGIKNAIEAMTELKMSVFNLNALENTAN
jgi:glyceraldehyde-3-phosphate dehydrogenase (NADP+)